MDSFRKAVSTALTARRKGTATDTTPKPESPTEGKETGDSPTQDTTDPDHPRSDTTTQSGDPKDNHKEGEESMRYQTIKDLKQDPNRRFYLPTVEKLLSRGLLKGKGGEGDDLIIDLSEDAVRILVTLDRAGAYGEE